MLGFSFAVGALGSLRRSAITHSRYSVSTHGYLRTSPARATVAEPKSPSERKEKDVSERKEQDALAPVKKYLDAGLGVVVLNRGKARLFRIGRNPMVFGGAVERSIPPTDKALHECDPVVVCDGAFSCIGFGFFNSRSMFRVRLLRHASPSGEHNVSLPWNFEEDIFQRLQDAVSLRQSIGLPNNSTNVYRVVNGEGDRLSGLVVDRVDDTLIVSSSALWCETYINQILRGLEKVLPQCEDIVWRPNIDRLRQDGLKEEQKAPPPEEGETVPTDVSEPSVNKELDHREDTDVVVREADVRYAISRYALTRGQKTGHYADQRENRTFIRDLVKANSQCRRVLDLFCYSGGFSLNVALGNPEVTVTAVDSSLKALVMGRKNAELNGVADRVNFVQSDVMKHLRNTPAEHQESYDLVIVDPPKYAPNAKALPRATHKYRSLNSAAIKMVKHGGLLCTCSCSAAMSQDRDLFVEAIRVAAMDLGRELTLLKTFGAAADHPVTPEMPESEYLTACIFVCR